MKPCKSKERTITVLFLNTIFFISKHVQRAQYDPHCKINLTTNYSRKEKKKKKKKKKKIAKLSIKFCTNKNRRIRSMGNEPLSSKYDKIISI
jgi:hypothetical protein